MSDRLVYGKDFAIALCEAFGEDPGKVHTMKLEFVPGTPVFCEIQRMVDSEEGKKIVEIIKAVDWIDYSKGEF